MPDPAVDLQIRVGSWWRDMSEDIRYEVAEGVAIVMLDRPEKRNAMSYSLLAKFHEAIARASTQGEVRALVAAFLERRPPRFVGR
jgi:enoyl-CoA hydratase/carnithine racemase